MKVDDGIEVSVYAGALYETVQIPAGRTWVGDDFDDGNAEGWTAHGGIWEAANGTYSGKDNAEAYSLWDNKAFKTGKVWARVKAANWSGHDANGFLVFDYRDEGNYRYAGLSADEDKWVIGERLGGSNHARAWALELNGINTGQWYSLEVVVSGDRATLKAGGVQKVSYTFADGIQGGGVGLRVKNARAYFDDVAVSPHVIDDLRDGDAEGWTPTGGTWQVHTGGGGEYSGQAATNGQVSVREESMTSGTLEALMATQATSGHTLNAFLVFDYQAATNYKFAGMDDSANRSVIEEVVSGTVNPLESNAGRITTGQWYDVEVEVSGDTATLKVDGQKVDCAFEDGIPK